MKVCEVTIQYKNEIPKSERVSIKSANSVYRIVKPFFEPYMDYREGAYLVLMNKGNELLGVSELSKGGIDSTVLDIRMIAQLSLLSNATNIIVVHNHPSGTLKASDSDISISKRILESMRQFNILLLDSIIVSSEGYYSLSDNNLI